MKTTQEYISLIGSHAEELKTMFGIRSLRIFGSVSRNEHKEGSDVDVCRHGTQSLLGSSTEAFSGESAAMLCRRCQNAQAYKSVFT
ncbi:MAG: nucleotidyltransferase domain-containing protein [Prevotella sp.]|nr:nucleotidyltransferase domain-containing protein [Prevotella sp.]